MVYFSPHKPIDSNNNRKQCNLTQQGSDYGILPRITQENNLPNFIENVNTEEIFSSVLKTDFLGLFDDKKS